MAKLLFEWDYSSSPGAKMYPHLFKPIQIGNLVVPNRIKYAATEDILNTQDGFITDANIAYMKIRGEGVVGGLCFMQGVYMDEARQGQGYAGQAAAWDDKFIPGLKRMADAMHAEKAIAGFQLMDCGRLGAEKLDHAHGPSAVAQCLRIIKHIKQMTHADMKAMIQQHMDAAHRGIQAGFDVVEISGTVGYLISNFISSDTIHQTDEYGSEFHARMQAALEIIQGVKEICGPDIPLGIRLCSNGQPDQVRGIAPQKSMETYKIVEEAGVDYISVTLGWQESIWPALSREIPIGTWIHLSKEAKAHVDIPVQMAYRLFKPDLPNEKIGAGELDIWEICRSMIADPLMPKKVLEGRENEIRHCVNCDLCQVRFLCDAPMTCYINPLCAHESDPDFYPQVANAEKDVMIVGAGPAGMECAYVAAQRGHNVTVYDQRNELGGTLNEAAMSPYDDAGLLTCTEYQTAMCAKTGVTLKLGTKVTEELIEDEMPDAVVLATGSLYSDLQVPGMEKIKVVNILDVLSEKTKVGEKIVIWGNCKPGIGTALHLAKKGKQISILGKEKAFAFNTSSPEGYYMICLHQNKVTAYNDCDIDKVTDDGIIVKTFDGYRFPLRCDTIVACKRKANDSLKNVAQSKGAELFTIGDALAPRNLSSAVHDGYRIGIQI